MEYHQIMNENRCEDYPCCGHTDGLPCNWVAPDYTAHALCDHENGICEEPEDDEDDEAVDAAEEDERTSEAAWAEWYADRS